MSFFSKIIFKYLIPIEFKSELKKSALQKKIEESILEETYNYFHKKFKKSLLFETKNDVRKYSIKKAIENSNPEDFFLEFGCYKGTSA